MKEDITLTVNMYKYVWQNFDHFLSMHVTSDSINYMNLYQQTHVALTFFVWLPILYFPTNIIID